VTIQVFTCEQGTEEWFRSRMGIPTASEFSTVMAKGEGKTRKTYMLKLAGELLTGEPMDSYTNANIERGKIMEDEARDLYAFLKNADPQKIGFIRNGDAGCSPDSLLNDGGGLEIKTALPHIQIDRLMKDELPPEHRAQVQGSIWITERDWWDFVSYCSPKLPLFVKRIYRDNGYIANLKGEVDRFNDELQAIVGRVRKYGAEEAAA
jgi:hypothetical protein